MFKETKAMEKVELEFKEWKKDYGDIKQIKNMSNRNKTQERKKLIDNAWIIRDEKGKLIISGGGKIILFLVSIFGKGWKAYLEDTKKRRHYGQYLEVKQYLHRQKFYKIDLLPALKKFNPEDILKDNGKIFLRKVYENNLWKRMKKIDKR